MRVIEREWAKDPARVRAGRKAAATAARRTLEGVRNGSGRVHTNPKTGVMTLSPPTKTG